MTEQMVKAAAWLGENQVDVFIVEASRAQDNMAAEPFRRTLLPDGAVWTEYYRVEGGFYLRFPALADFQISTLGHEVHCWPTPAVSPATVQHLFLNHILPLAVSRRGKLVLHASAIEIGAGAVVFAGA